MNSPSFNLIIKPTGAQCNLACEYCYFLKKENLYKGSRFRMGDEILETFIRQYLESQPSGEVYFTWQGGEPTLMGVPFFKKAVALQQRYLAPGQTVKNALQTNGHFLDEDWCRFLKVNDFLVGLSIDGPPRLHDAHRKDKAGQGTHVRTLFGLELLNKHGIKTNILACISDANVCEPVEVYRYFRDTLGMQHLQFIPIVERANKTGSQRGEKLTSRSISGKAYGEFLISIFNEWVSRDVGSIFVQLFEVCVGVWLGMPASICIFGEICGSCLAIEHTGDLFACDHYVQPDALLGSVLNKTISEMTVSSQQQTFGMNKKTALPEKCQRCDVRFICNGGCPKNRILPPKNESQPINHLCEGYQTFFRHIDKPLKMMAALINTDRPAAEILTMQN